MSSAPLTPDHILHEIGELWGSLGRQPESDAPNGVLRACSMTLIVAADEGDDPREIAETLANLMAEHPSRAIVVRLRDAPEAPLQARVFAECRLPFGGRRQICCEQVEITASFANLTDLPPLLTPVAAPDLPVMVWCRSSRLFAMPEFSHFAEMAHKVIVDTSGASDPAPGVERLLGAVHSGRRVADLSWIRITRWREWIAQTFENRSYLDRLSEVTRVHIRHTGSSIPMPAWYMGAWLQDSLASAGIAAQVTFEQGGAAPAAIESVELQGDAPGSLHLSAAFSGPQAVEVKVNGLVNCTIFAPPSDHKLIREELSISGKDAVFERTLERLPQLMKPGGR